MNKSEISVERFEHLLDSFTDLHMSQQILFELAVEHGYLCEYLDRRSEQIKQHERKNLNVTHNC